MQEAAFGGTPFSAVVDLWLVSDHDPERSLPLNQAGKDFIAVSEPATLPAGPAWVYVSVDGEAYRNRVYLVNGVDPQRSRTAITCYKDDVPF